MRAFGDPSSSMKRLLAVGSCDRAAAECTIVWVVRLVRSSAGAAQRTIVTTVCVDEGMILSLLQLKQSIWNLHFTNPPYGRLVGEAVASASVPPPAYHGLHSRHRGSAGHFQIRFPSKKVRVVRRGIGYRPFRIFLGVPDIGGRSGTRKFAAALFNINERCNLKGART